MGLRRIGSLTTFWLVWILVTSFGQFIVFTFLRPDVLQADRYRLLGELGIGHVLVAVWFAGVFGASVWALRTRAHGAIVAAISGYMVALSFIALAIFDKALRGPTGGWELVPWVMSGAIVSGWVLLKGD